MEYQKPLTKESFWNEQMEKFPKSMKIFCAWIDEYKKAVNWESLFGNDINAVHYKQHQIKFHDIPYEMQYGIWMWFCREKMSEFFEQSEHPSELIDLEENIKEVFGEMEPLIDDED